MNRVARSVAGGSLAAAPLLLLFAAATPLACKKAAPPPPPAAPAAPVAAVAKAPPLPPVPCPAAEGFAPFLADAGPPAPEVKDAKGKPTKAKPAKKPGTLRGQGGPTRALRSSCVEFAPGRFWLAAVLTYDEGSGKNPRLGLVSGGAPDSRWILFDVTPLPTEQIEKLLASSAQTGVQIRKTRNDTGLVRLGVTGGPGGGKPDQQEVGLLLQLMAHKPPHILWEGPGDHIATGDDGCVTEQSVDFELLFRTRLERFTIGKIRPDASGKIPPTCKSDPSMQESMNMSPVPLAPGRAFAEAAKAAAPPG
jgi:hypothetical protein